jgi:RNA polymerase sigma-70 factor (ECF subfamily)
VISNGEKSESDLVLALKNDDARAFDTLFAYYAKRLHYFSFGFLKSKEEAEGVVQEVFLKVWRNRKQLKPELSFKAYLFKIAYHSILEIFKQNSRRQTCLHDIISEVIPFSSEMNNRLNYQMLLEKVDTIITQLPPRQQEVLIKRKKEGIPIKEIAAQLDLSPKTVENHLTEALKNVKRRVGEEFIASMFD